MAEMSSLRRRMIEDMTIRNLSPATQQSYLHWVSKFSRYFGRSPHRLVLEDVRAFQVHLASEGLSWGSLNQAVCALKFFYGVTLGQATIPERIPYARKPRKLPVVLSADEVARFLESVSSLKARVALTTAYAAGLRVSEVAALKVQDIDSQRMVIRIEHGKGGKERYVMLSQALLGILRSYWRLTRPKIYLFPGRTADKPVVPETLHAACRSATAAAGLGKGGSASGSACMCCGIVSRRISWRAASTSASSRCCWVTRTCQRRLAIRESPRISSAIPPAPWIACR
jgi:integrase/recombinase XerD